MSRIFCNFALNMAADKKILFVSQEITPYLTTGEASDLGRLLPQGMPAKRYEVRTFMPKFGNVNERRNQLHEVIRLSGLNITINDNDHPLIIKVASMQPSRIQVYFIDSDDYFQKTSDDADDYGSNRDDNDERAIFFARGTMETVKKLRWEPDIVQCSGWITALAPIYLRNMYASDPAFSKAKVVYMVMPGEITGKVDPEILRKLAEDGASEESLRQFEAAAKDTSLLHKMAISASDAVIFHTSEPDPELLEIVKAKGLPYATSDELGSDPAKYIEFYDKISQ